MDLSDALLALVAPLAPGDELLPGVRLLRVSTELGLRLTFEDGERLVHVEVLPATPPRPHAARSAELAFAYRLSRDGTPVDAARALALCRTVADRASAHEAKVLSALRASAGNDRPVREVRGARLLELAESADRRYYTLSPYVGCLIGCRFCYAQERVGLVRSLRGLAARPWGSYVDARVDAPERLREELAELPALPIKLCPIVSDPYHAVEQRLELTRRCLLVLAGAEPRPVFVLTRAKLVERDADVLARMPEVEVGMSIPTIDDAVARFFEPRAASISERLEVLAGMRARGIRTFAVVQPLLPGAIEELADALARVVSSVSVDVLRGEEGASELFNAHPDAREDDWQRDRAAALVHALEERGVLVWDGELPRA